MQKCGGQILFTSKSLGKTWRLKTPAKMCCTFLGKSAGEAGRVFLAIVVDWWDFSSKITDLEIVHPEASSLQTQQK